MRYLLQWLVCIFLIFSVCAGVNAAGPALVDDSCKDSDGRLSMDAKGVLTDHQSGLQWFAGYDRDTSRQEARDWIDSLGMAGAPWRMPAYGELQTLYNACGVENGVPRMFGLMGSWVWAAERLDNRRQGAGRYRAVAFDSGKSLDLDATATFNLRALAVRSERRQQEDTVYRKTVRGPASDRIYISTSAPAIRVVLDQDFTLVKDGMEGEQALFNRKGEVAYVLIRHSEDIAAPAQSGQLQGLRVESWIAQLHQERILDAGALVMAGQIWLYIDRIFTGDSNRRAVFTRDLRLYVGEQQFLDIVFIEGLDAIDGRAWSDCRPLTARQKQYIEKVIDGFAKKVEVQKFSN